MVLSAEVGDQVAELFVNGPFSIPFAETCPASYNTITVVIAMTAVIRFILPSCSGRQLVASKVETYWSRPFWSIAQAG